MPKLLVAISWRAPRPGERRPVGCSRARCFASPQPVHSRACRFLSLPMPPADDRVPDSAGARVGLAHASQDPNPSRRNGSHELGASPANNRCGRARHARHGRRVSQICHNWLQNGGDGRGRELDLDIAAVIATYATFLGSSRTRSTGRSGSCRPCRRCHRSDSGTSARPSAGSGCATTTPRPGGANERSNEQHDDGG